MKKMVLLVVMMILYGGAVADSGARQIFTGNEVRDELQRERAFPTEIYAEY
ncbi:MAG: hypothetical protein GTN53_10830, partial [Candidatus Aminicenantes bacterium]|nr:hypothetical protein [Candidatus Aminicenantes bacterium]NIQ66949.1 hypothetical protein [Candidatus Aminicenantes bacterium]NIT22989.1 hypothetical protein [Candidatus Aminicenantes bacterium]